MFLPKCLEKEGCCNEGGAFFARLSAGGDASASAVDSAPRAEESGQLEDLETEDILGSQPSTYLEKCWAVLTAGSFGATAVIRIEDALQPDRKNKAFTFEVIERIESWRELAQLLLDVEQAPDTDPLSHPPATLHHISDVWKRWCSIPCTLR